LSNSGVTVLELGSEREAASGERESTSTGTGSGRCLESVRRKTNKTSAARRPRPNGWRLQPTPGCGPPIGSPRSEPGFLRKLEGRFLQRDDRVEGLARRGLKAERVDDDLAEGVELFGGALLHDGLSGSRGSRSAGGRRGRRSETRRDDDGGGDVADRAGIARGGRGRAVDFVSRGAVLAVLIVGRGGFVALGDAGDFFRDIGTDSDCAAGRTGFNEVVWSSVLVWVRTTWPSGSYFSEVNVVASVSISAETRTTALPGPIAVDIDSTFFGEVVLDLLLVAHLRGGGAERGVLLQLFGKDPAAVVDNGDLVRPETLHGVRHEVADGVDLIGIEPATADIDKDRGRGLDALLGSGGGDFFRLRNHDAGGTHALELDNRAAKFALEVRGGNSCVARIGEAKLAFVENFETHALAAGNAFAGEIQCGACRLGRPGPGPPCRRR